MITLTPKIKNELWWLIISVDYNYSRIAIAEHEINGQHLTIWLEDKQDFKNTLEECLKLDIPLKQFKKFIKLANLNCYEGTRMHPKKQFLYKTLIPINDPLQWYLNDATPTEQLWTRDNLLKHILTQLVETDICQNRLSYLE
ncbi:hypothetical protein KHS38_09740 [Mucilaginibacter sp. Bleaf8]|uniref:hypothetical protein n=1 Tax=Mucilaginibacter sp. Bleaf8 TaxID=2834430 RepID=UPI001BCDCAE2|nr:hypothetical protein [Mucilaginibacter sp. Bleaf8]MBS7564685.1 hypothetical protein [Mucilaginibacter sp. Bleaf8]